MTTASDTAPRMLPEPEAALVLAAHGIPYVDHGFAMTELSAVAHADRVGYPVVLKVVSPDIVHKAEAGGVVVGVRDEYELASAYAMLLKQVRSTCPDARVEGVLVARQVTGRRELIIGGIRDATFGPVVMVGIGGVFAEALGDVVFRLAPLRSNDGSDMLDELHGARLLSGFRGEPPVDRNQVAGLVVSVGDLLLEHPEIQEIDLNPVVATA